ncbi:hypothetical protein BP5796_10688 [Coleophoma crateriformis]|uniref:BTB domain-containing protein n=1 Tax=Coleophoma crateriformis TaxID=565419 RepID=A0A3D8QQU1_9HELO|nr:hypothetical protein BP5796_10688 [Coleophoma crateriformis]
MPRDNMARSVYPDLDGVTTSDNAPASGHTGMQHDADSDDELLSQAFNSASIADETFEPTNLPGNTDGTNGEAQQNASSFEPIVSKISELIAEYQRFDEDGFAEILAPVIIFVVGEESVQFPVKLELARRHSPVIDALFGNVIDIEVFRVDDTTVEAMRLLVYYFENAKLDVGRPDDDDYTMSPEDKKKIRDQHDINLVNLYILAGNFNMPKLQNWVIWNLDMLHDDGVPMSPATIPMVYGFKNPDKIINLKALLIHQYTWGRTWELNIGVFPTQMVFDMMSKMHSKFTKEDALENYCVDLSDYYLPMDE